MMDTRNKQTLRAALAAVRKQYHDDISDSIINEPDRSYIQIARDHGCSEQWVYNIARLRGIGRNQFKDDEAVDD